MNKTPHKRILMISDHSDPLATMGGEESGGQNIYVHQLGIHLVRKRFAVDVFTRHSDPSLPQVSVSKEGGYRVVRIKAGPTKFIPKEDLLNYIDEFTNGIVSYLEKNKLQYDVIHSHYWLSGLAALALKRRLGLPVVHNFHSLGKIKHLTFHQHDESALRREQHEQEIVERMDALIVTSPGERQHLIHLYRAEPRKIWMIPIGVDAAHFSPEDKFEAKKALNVSAKHALLYVGRFAEQKGLPVLLQAYAMARRELPSRTRAETKLYIVGGTPVRIIPPEKEQKELLQMKALIAHHKLEQCIEFVGNIPNRETARYYNAADVCIIPSLYEPFGIVALEAMACGTPVLVSHVGGLGYTVQNLRTGMHARANDVADFAYKLRLLLENKNLRSELGKNGRLRIEETFTWDRVSDELAHMYYRVSDRAKSAMPRVVAGHAK